MYKKYPKKYIYLFLFSLPNLKRVGHKARPENLHPQMDAVGRPLVQTYACAWPRVQMDPSARPRVSLPPGPGPPWART